MDKWAKFTIGFDQRDKARLFDYWNDILANYHWTEGYYTKQFEEKWAAWNGLPAVAFNSWSGAAMCAMAYYQLDGKAVTCPTNTFIAVPLAIHASGANPIYGDCRRDDLCLTIDAFNHQWSEAAWVTHIGGHIAFDIDKIAATCKKRHIPLLEDCAHAHGASWNDKKPGTWGDAGVWSFYATKTISTGEGGMLVSKHPDLIEFAREYRNYGKPLHNVRGLNYRMSEFTAALGYIQVDRMEEIVQWKNEVAEKLKVRYPNHIKIPDGMVSGRYKFITFEPGETTCGRVYDTPCHRIIGIGVGSFPNAEWVSQNHWCQALYYNP